MSEDIQIKLDPEVTVGLYVEVLDSLDDVRYHAAKVIDITDQNVMVHYYDTKIRQLREAKWVPLYHHPDTNQIVQHDLQTYPRKANTRY